MYTRIYSKIFESSVQNSAFEGDIESDSYTADFYADKTYPNMRKPCEQYVKKVFCVYTNIT